jgi:hypothetical protein
MRLLKLLVLSLALAACSLPEQPVVIRNDVRVILKVANLPEGTLGSARYLPQTNTCIIILKSYPTCLLHEIRHCFEGNWQLADGTWKQAWRVRPANEKEIEQQARSVRADRNQRLAVCDWTQLPDAPVDQAAWAAYRQALRDVTAQSGFPWSVVWPDAPAN